MMNRSAKYSLQDILFQITENNYTFCRIFDGWQTTISEDMYPIRVLRDNQNSDQLKERVAEFLKRFNCPLTLFFKNYETNTNKNAVLVHYRPDSEPVENSTRSMNTLNSSVNADVLNFAVEIERLKAQIRENEMIREKKDLQDQLEEARSVQAKWSMIADTIVDRIFPLIAGSKKVSEESLMQGFYDGQTIDFNELQGAVEYLIELFGEQGLIELANLLKEKPEFVSIVKSQINK